ncbi:MAG: rhodanese-like domain-containing protein [Ignavibacteria bacterium]|nr:rhodanese-like domain-containing protein [Ignavibacteria bacterium]
MFNFFGGANDIDCETFENLVKEGYTVLDVRTKDENVQARITDCTQIDFYSPDFKQKISELDKNGKYIIYCRSGNRSRQTESYMSSNGFKDVKNLKGGIITWYNSGRIIIQD